MLRRLLSWMGFAWYLPSADELGVKPGDAPQTDGRATVAYKPGRRLAASKAEAEEMLDERREQITDKDLVWPGKTETIHIRNDEPIACRYDVSLTDLEPTYFVARPPVGGQWQPDGGVLLQPGEEASFEVSFVPLPPQTKARPRTFSLVVTRFDPRRANDPGEVYGEIPLRWVNLPAPADLQLASHPKEVVMRPWRRSALFQVEMQNRSELPPSLQLNIQRAGTRAGLTDQPETVGTVNQSLPSRTPGLWHCLLPPSAVRNSYFATVNGTARVAENVEYGLALPQPVFIRYVPWLRKFKDWLFLFVTLFFLMWLVWGVPIPKSPVVYLNLNFEGANGVPAQGVPEDVKVTLIPINGRQDGAPVKGKWDGNHYVFANIPGGWYGYRWPFGWNGSSRDPLRFTVQVEVDDAKKDVYQSYNLKDVRPEANASDKMFVSEGEKRPFFGEWAVNATAVVRRSAGLKIHIESPDLGAATGKADNVVLKWTFGEQTGEKTVSVPLKDKLVTEFDLGAPTGAPRLFSLTATTSPYQIKGQVSVPDLKASKDTIPITLKFSREQPTAFVRFAPAPREPCIIYLQVEDGNKKQRMPEIAWDGVTEKVVEVKVPNEGAKLKYAVVTRVGTPGEVALAGGGGVFVELSSDPSKKDVPITVQAPPAVTIPPVGDPNNPTNPTDPNAHPPGSP